MVNKNVLAATDICAIIKACSENGVKVFTYGGMKIDFQQSTPPEVVQEYIPEVVVAQATQVAKDTNFKDEYKAVNDGLDMMLLEDPLAYEEALIRGDLRDEKA